MSSFGYWEIIVLKLLVKIETILTVVYIAMVTAIAVIDHGNVHSYYLLSNKHSDD